MKIKSISFLITALIIIVMTASAPVAAEELQISLDGAPTQTPSSITSDSGFSIQGKFVNALELYNEAIDLGNSGDFTAALEKLNAAIAIDENFTVAYAAKAGILAALGDYENGLIAAKKATTLNPKQADAWVNMASILNSLGSYEQALDACEKALALNVTDKDTLLSAYINQGTAYGGLKHYNDEITASENALKIDPSNQLALSNKEYATAARDGAQNASPVSTAVIMVGIGLAALFVAYRRQ